MPFPLIPVAIGGVVLAGTGVALRLRSIAKKKAVSSVTPSSTPVATAAQVAQAAQDVGVSVQQLNTAAVAAGTTPAVLVGAAIQAGGSVADQILAAAQNPAAAAAVLPQSATAVVTTNDPPPAGDLIVRNNPSTSADQIGGADKDGTVTVLNPDAAGDNIFAEIQWDGGRNPAVRGFVKKAFLRLV